MDYNIFCSGQDVKRYPRYATLSLNLIQYDTPLVVNSKDTYYIK